MIRRHQSARCRLAVTLLLFGALSGLGACTTSTFLVGALYDRADDKAMDRIDDWIPLRDEQRSEVAAYLGTFHTWHRRHELPRYAALMRTVADGLSTWDQATPADFQHWFGEVGELAQSARDCHPAHFATALAGSLSEQQIDHAERKWLEQRDENRSQKNKRTREQRIARRVGNIDKWLGRIGLELDEDQLELIRTTFLQQKSLRDRYRKLSDDWNTRLFAIARDRDAADQRALLDAHVDRWFGQIERAYPDEFEANRQNWLQFAVAFEKTLSRLQRRTLLAWMNDMADTLDAISRDEADWLPADDPAYGCVLEGGGAASD